MSAAEKELARLMDLHGREYRELVIDERNLRRALDTNLERQKRLEVEFGMLASGLSVLANKQISTNVKYFVRHLEGLPDVPEVAPDLTTEVPL